MDKKNIGRQGEGGPVFFFLFFFFVFFFFGGGGGPASFCHSFLGESRGSTPFETAHN